MRNILFVLLLFVSSFAFSQSHDYNLKINPNQDPDSVYILATGVTGSDFVARGRFKNLSQISDLIKPYLGCIDTVLLNDGDSIVIYTTDGDTIGISVAHSLFNAWDTNYHQIGLNTPQSHSGGTITFQEGTGITLTTTGTSQDATVTIASTASGGSDNWGTDVVNHDNTLTGNGTVATPLKVDSSKIATQYDISGFLSSETQGIDNVLSQNQMLSTNRSIDVSGSLYNFDIEYSTKKFFYINPTGEFSLGDIDALNNGTYLTIIDGTKSVVADNPNHDLLFGINQINPAQALDVTGNGIFTGTLTASNLSGTNTGDQDLSGYALTSSVPTQENIEDYTGGMVSGNTETGISVTYDDTNGKLDFVATDQSATNEIQDLSITGASAPYTLDISGSSNDVNIDKSGIITLTESPANTLVIGATEVDGSTTNELQTFTNSSDATSHTVTLSASGGSVQLVEGSNITLTTTGTAGDGVVTIASTGGAGYTDEEAQDAVGAMVNTSLTYVDATPSLALTSRNINGTAFNGTANISVPASGKTFTWDGNGGIPATGSTIFWVVPTNCTLTGWSFWATGSSPTATIDVWKVAAGTTLPAVGNSIISGTKPALSTGNVVRSSTLSAFTDTTFDAGEIIGINLDAVTVTTLLQFQLEFN